MKHFSIQGPVVQSPISINPGLTLHKTKRQKSSPGIEQPDPVPRSLVGCMPALIAAAAGGGGTGNDLFTPVKFSQAALASHCKRSATPQHSKANSRQEYKQKQKDSKSIGKLLRAVAFELDVSKHKRL